MLTFRYRLFPSNSQQSKLWIHANKLNSIYNYFLNQRIENYKNNIIITKKIQQAELVKLKKDDPILKEIHSQVLQQVPLRLDNSYQSFFRRVKSKQISGFPKFRSCRKFFGICYPQSGFSIQNNIFHTKVYGDIQFIKHRELKGNIKQIFISCKNNQFYLNITTDYEKPKLGKSKIGIDIGLKTLVVGVDENGKVIEKIDNRRDAKYFDKQIAFLQNKRSNLTKGSRQYRFLSKVIQRLYDAKIRKIDDYQHNVSKRLGSTYDTIFAEDLSVKEMSESDWTNLNKSIRNAKLAQLITFLKYKTNEVILVNPKNTSKTCHNCGYIHKDLKLSDREIVCERCGNKYDRDENAARNIYCLGQAILDNPEYVGELTLQEVLTFK